MTRLSKASIHGAVRLQCRARQRSDQRPRQWTNRTASLKAHGGEVGVEEQTATTAELGRSVGLAAEGAGGVAASIEVVATSSPRTADGVAQAQQAVVELTSVAGELSRRVGQFRV